MNIKRKTNYYLPVFLMLFLWSACDNKNQIRSENFQQITSDFTTPNDSNTIWCYWYWINDDISKRELPKT